MGVGDTLVYIWKESQKKKEQEKSSFSKASERKDKLTYDHVVLFRLYLLMQDFNWLRITAT